MLARAGILRHRKRVSQRSHGQPTIGNRRLGAPSGATLLLALLILGTLTATSVTIGAITTSTLRSARAIDDATIASYAAESAIEELLSLVRKEERNPQDPTQVPKSGVLTNGATWERRITGTVPQLTLMLMKDRVEQLDLFDPSGELREMEMNIRTLVITPQRPDADAWLEVSWVPWLLTGAWAPSVEQVVFSPSELPMRSEKRIPLTPRAMDGTPAAYRVRLRSLTGDVGIVTVRALNQSNLPVALPARIRATVIGTVRGSRSALVTEFPARTPLLPLFDFVLFSECDIVKGDDIRCP